MVLIGSNLRLAQVVSDGAVAGPRRVRLFCRFKESYVVAADWAEHLELEWLEARRPSRFQHQYGRLTDPRTSLTAGRVASRRCARRKERNNSGDSPPRLLFGRVEGRFDRHGARRSHLAA